MIEKLKQTALAFLYIFIRPNANLAPAIMQKREAQITILKRLDAIGLASYAELKEMIWNAIKSQTGFTPYEILTDLNSGVGVSTAQAEKPSKSIAESIPGILDGVKDIIETIGSNDKSDKVAPSQADWVSQHQPSTMASLFSVENILPVAVTVGIAYFLLTADGKKTKKRKK